MTKINYSKEAFSKNDLNLFFLFKLFWQKSYLLLLPFIFFILLGYYKYKNLPTEYTAQCILLGEEPVSSDNTNILKIANLVSTENTNNSFSDLYPIILANKPFLIELSKDTIFDEKNNKTTLFDFIQNPNRDVISNELRRKQNTNPNIGRLNTNFEILSNEDEAVCDKLKSKIKFKKVGRQIIISVTTSNAKISAEATNLLLNKLIDYVTKYKTKKQLDNLNFLNARFEEAKERFEKKRIKSANFTDTYVGAIFESIKSTQTQLQNEANITLNTYNLLASQLEQANIDLKKQTPLFTIFEPIYLPKKPDIKSATVIIKKSLIGLVIGIIFIFLSLSFDYYKFNKNKII